MFDVGFSEIFLLGLIRLLVLGPERLPGVARTIGGFVRKARTSWNSFSWPATFANSVIDDFSFTASIGLNIPLADFFRKKFLAGLFGIAKTAVVHSSNLIPRIG